MPSRGLTILDGSTFVVSAVGGDLQGDDRQPFGFFYRDTRHLSAFDLRLDGRRMEPLAHDEPDYDCVLHHLVSARTGHDAAEQILTRRRRVGDGLCEELSLRHFGPAPLEAEITINVDADFADIFEVKASRPIRQSGTLERRVDPDGALVLRFSEGPFTRETTIRAPGAATTTRGLTFVVRLDPGSSWCARIDVTVTSDKPVSHKPTLTRGGPPRPNIGHSLDHWLESSPRLVSDDPHVTRLYRRSLVDLASLRFYPDVVPGQASLPAAGAPWYMAMFGRDSLITSYQALPFQPELAATTLRALAARQATEVDDFHDAEPGKILHELRFGRTTVLGETPQSPYYGSADATPLFLILLDEYERWTGDQELVRSLEPAARAAVDWIEHYGDRDGDGYVEYERRNTRSGLENQCWKDSWNSIVHPDGTLATLPRATCELQGYAYDARRRTARLARTVWGDQAMADRLDQQADALRDRFNRDFWSDELGTFVLALDGDKHQVRTLSSNAGQLLWSGIVLPERSPQLVERLMSPEMFSGWGIRTLASGHAAFNPLGYHTGTVWPHDNALIASGLARYGFRDEATRVIDGLVAAAHAFHGRLPEVFAGFTRTDTEGPLPYPDACSPQAWASGTPLLLFRVILGLEPLESQSARPLHTSTLGSFRFEGPTAHRGTPAPAHP